MRFSAADLHPSRLLPSVVAGGVAGMITVVLSISFAILIFAGRITPHLPAGIGLALFSAALVAIIVSASSSYPGTIAIPQDRIAPILAIISTAIVGGLDPSVSSETAFLTVVAAICLASLLTGFALLGLGVFRLGALIRYIPYPVIGGFLAGTGWLLFLGSLRVMTDIHVSFSTLGELTTPDAISRWAPGVAFGVVMLLLTRKISHYLLTPGLLIAAVVVFYGVLAAMGVSADEARADRWLLGPFPRGGSWRPLTWVAITGADWPAVLGQAGSIATVLLVSAVSVLLNSSALELAAERDIDLDRELRVTGAANIALGLGGGMVGFHTLSLSALVLKMGSRSRIAGMTQALVVLLVLFAGPAVLEAFPKPVLGGLLCFLGLSFLAQWCWDGWKRLSRTDWLTVMLILGFVGVFGYLQGVGVGIAACVAVFVMEYSRAKVVGQSTSGAIQRSNVDRPPRHTRLLTEEGQQTHIMRLTGYLFFGTANRVLLAIRARLEDPDLPALRYVVMDLRWVTGIDSSAVMSFVKLRQLAGRGGFMLVLTSASDDIIGRLAREGLELGTEDPTVRSIVDLDHGLEWCEEQIIAAAAQPVQRQGEALHDRFARVLGESADIEGLLARLDRRTAQAGEVILAEGADSNCFYMIDSGQVRVQVTLPNGELLRVRTLNAGSVIGELGLYLGSQRSASVVANRETQLYRVTDADLERLAQEQPLAAATLHRFLAYVLADRLTQVNGQLRTLMA